MTPVGLTAKQSELLAFIKGRLAASTIPPSFSEMAAHLGLKSKSGVFRLVDALVERGHLVRMRHRARAIALPDPGREPSVAQSAERLDPGLTVRLSPYLTQRLEAYCRERKADPATVIDIALYTHITGGRS